MGHRGTGAREPGGGNPARRSIDDRSVHPRTDLGDERHPGSNRRLPAGLARHHRQLRERHPCVGATRSIGLFGCLELVHDPQTLEPLAPFNGTSAEMKAIAQALLDAGMHTFVRWNTIMTNPPLCITEAELDEGLEILDGALELGDRAARG